MLGGIPQPLRTLGAAAAVVFGGMFSLSLASSVTIRMLQAATEAKRVVRIILPVSFCLWPSLWRVFDEWSRSCTCLPVYTGCQKKVALPCTVCKGMGFYTCKLCKGKSTIKWSPLYDPIVINPCLCPTCEGNRVQRCLNCLGKGYV